MASLPLVPITDHTDRAVARLVEQYKSRPLIEGLVRALCQEIQELEDVDIDMFDSRTLDGSVGAQLDGLGDIVGIDRQGFDDAFYKTLIIVKIGQNTSQGRPEKLITIAALLTGATLLHYINLGNAEVALSVNLDISSQDVEFIYNNLQKITSAGVRINYIACFDPDESFSFDGVGPFGLGFSSLAAPTSGGKFAFLHRRDTPFAFFGTDVDADGFGALGDPYAGGVFEGL